MATGMGMTITGCLVAAAVSLCLWWCWKTWSLFQTISKMGLSGPKPSFLTGNMKDITSKGFGAAFKDWEKQYGPVYGIYRFKRPSIVIHDPDMLREIMVKQFDTFPNRTKLKISERKPLCNMLQSMEDHHWRHVRKTLSPGFSSGKLKSMLPVIKRSCRHLIQRIDQTVQTGEKVDTKDLANAFSMDVTAGAGFGLEVNCLLNPSEPFGVIAKRLLYPPQWRFTLLFLFPWLGALMAKVGLGVFSPRDTGYLLNIIRTALAERRHDKQRKYKDYLQCLVDAEREEREGKKKEEEEEKEEEDNEDPEQEVPVRVASPWTRKGLTEEEIEANSLNFLLAGYENTASGIAFLLYNLAGSPHCLQALQREVDSVLGQDEVDYRAVTDMPYLDMCLNESLRLYPPGIMLDRVCVKGTRVKGLHVPKGVTIIIPVYSVHTNPAHWPDPLTFNPERHTTEAKAERHPFSFLPFGHGPRNCIGMRMSQMEVKMAVAAIVQKFTPVLCDESVFPAQISSHVRLGPVHTMWVKFNPR